MEIKINRNENNADFSVKLCKVTLLNIKAIRILRWKFLTLLKRLNGKQCTQFWTHPHYRRLSARKLKELGRIDVRCDLYHFPLYHLNQIQNSNSNQISKNKTSAYSEIHYPIFQVKFRAQRMYCHLKLSTRVYSSLK